MATIEVDGQIIEAEAGDMLITATDRAGIYIPRFCYHEKLSIAANCRMCLVEVEKAPKPLPACATPIMHGMKVFTRSKLAREAQQGTLEFLLINHPLDCPVCDQGGECPLQDQAMGYGNDDSRFDERKRAMPSHDIGPLVATEMTRCIHCTRCVRFGEEVAGAMEMGFPGRGEAAWIGTFLNRTVDSEVSGNMIDLCPVGALTSKPYRFAARAWELENHRSVSPHDCVGANLNIQTLRGRVERVLPIDNPQVNDCWLADRDRYSYEAVNSARRLTAPMIREHGAWKEVSWETALSYTCAGIRQAIASGGGNTSEDNKVAALAGYTSTLEEYYLLQKLVRALGGNNVDHRLQQSDFSDDAAVGDGDNHGHVHGYASASAPVSEIPIREFEELHAALLVGSNLRKEQPLLALRLRTATRNASNSACVSAINPLEYQQNFAVQTTITAGADLAAHLAGVAAEIASAAAIALPDEIADWAKQLNSQPTSHDDHSQAAHIKIAQSLLEAGEAGAVIVGALAQQHADAGAIKGLARWICHASGARLAILAPGNSVAAWCAGCVPHRGADGAPPTSLPSGGGHNAAAMFAHPQRAYLLLATDPELDSIHGHAAANALKNADFVARITAYRDPAAECAHVLLPMAAFTESAGTFINCEGRAQPADAAASPQGESRPAWKILRVLGNFLDLPGFDYVSLDQVSAEINLDSNLTQATQTNPTPPKIPAPRVAVNYNKHQHNDNNSLSRLLDMPMYRGDQIVRNAPALQKTADNPSPAAHLNESTINRLKLTVGEQVLVRCGAGDVRLPLRADERVPADCVYVPAGYAQTAALGAHGKVTVEKIQKKMRQKTPEKTQEQTPEKT